MLLVNNAPKHLIQSVVLTVLITEMSASAIVKETVKNTLKEDVPSKELVADVQEF